MILWDGYARLERERGNVKAAREVYKTALQAARALRPEQGTKTEDETELWAAWADMEWERGENSTCLAILIAATVGDGDIGEILVVFKPWFSFKLTIGVASLTPSPVNMLKASRVSPKQFVQC